MTKSRNILPPRRFFTEAEVELLIALYPDTNTQELAELFERDISSVHRKAQQLGLSKSRELIAREACENARREDHGGRRTRFGKGHVPANKGKPHPTRGRAAETQFKPGQKPRNWRPVGSTRVSRDGYIEIKIAEGMFNWRLLHQEIWRKAHGEIPKGHVVVFKDGNKQNCVLENLECITLQENMKRNTFHRYPKEIARLVQLRGALTRQINKHERSKA